MTARPAVPRRLLVALVALAAVTVLAVAGTAQAAPRVTVIGDSVQASFAFTPGASRLLGRGLDLRMEARSCRALSRPGCLGGTPESAVALAQALGPRLGDVVVVHVGYNDFAERYDADAAMGAFRRAGVRAVVWTTLREAHGHYARTNALIRAVARRAARRGDQPIVRIADWNAHSSAHGGWFTSDRVHLNNAGAMALAAFHREAALSVLAELGTSVDGRPVTTRMDAHALGVPAQAIAGDGDVLWVAGRRQLRARDDHNGHALPRVTRLRSGETLIGEPGGTGAWLHHPSTEPALTRLRAGAGSRRGPAGEGGAGTPRIAGPPARRWILTTCGADEEGCATGQRLQRVVSGRREAEAALSPGTVTHTAVGARALWVAAVGPSGGARLERRHPATGRQVRVTRLPRQPVMIAPARRGVWMLDRAGTLWNVSDAGRVKRAQRGVAAIAATDDQLWMVRRDRRTIQNLHPVTGAVRGEARARVRLSTAVALTRRHVWVLSDSGRMLLRLPRT